MSTVEQRNTPSSNISITLDNTAHVDDRVKVQEPSPESNPAIYPYVLPSQLPPSNAVKELLNLYPLATNHGLPTSFCEQYTPSLVRPILMVIVGEARHTTAGSARPILRPTLNGFLRGPHLYTQEEVDEIIALGIEAQRVKKRRKERRNRVRGSIEKVKRYIEKVNKGAEKVMNDIEEMNKEDRMELDKLIYDEDIPLIDFDNESLI